MHDLSNGEVIMAAVVQGERVALEARLSVAKATSAVQCDSAMTMPMA